VTIEVSNSRVVIASEAKQSISQHKERMDCFASLAMTVLDVNPHSRGADLRPGDANTLSL
jgi:hypothetical protein